MITVAVLLASVILATGGQLLLKAGMTLVGEVTSVVSEMGVGALLIRVVTTWQVIGGLVVFALSAVFWLVTLSRVPLSTAYPVVSLSYVLILAFSVIALGERPTPVVWAGAVLIMFGIALIGVGQR